MAVMSAWFASAEACVELVLEVLGAASCEQAVSPRSVLAHKVKQTAITRGERELNMGTTQHSHRRVDLVFYDN